jgi:nucleotide-binding universal stress UspA family protein
MLARAPHAIVAAMHPEPERKRSMFGTVIVGIDGYDGGRDALAFARSLEPDELHLVSAYPVDQVVTRASLRGFDELLRDDALRRLEAAAVDAGVDAARHAVADSSPARALQRTADEHEADLLVVGSCHHGAAGRVLLGDVSRGVLHGAPCPVAVVPHRFRATGRRLAVVLVAFDGSPEAREALELAAKVREDLDASLVAATAIGSVSVFNVSPQLIDWKGILDAERAEAEERTHAALDDIGAAAETRVVVGDAGSALTRAAEDADLIVTGSRGWGALRRVALGSTSDHLVHHAGCPVVVVPRPAAEAHRDVEPQHAHATS